MEAIPKGWFSWKFRITDGVKEIADLDMSSWRERGELHIAGLSYALFRKGLLRPTFLLELNGSEIASATKSGALRRVITLQHDGQTYYLRRKSLIRRSVALLNDLGEIGSVSPAGFVTRRANVDLPENLRLPVRIFIIWLVLILWKRDSDSAAAGTG